jgi:hypothetical protein
MMRSKKIVLIIVYTIVCSWVIAQPKLSKSDMVKMDLNIMASNKQKIAAKDPLACTAYKQLLKDADKALNYLPVTVMEKTALPPSGDKHDYMSIGPYWWPDPNAADGLPYVRKDGEINPEVKDYTDKENMPKLCDNVYNLSVAYYFSGDEKYANHASNLLRVWFLDSATKMNPNLKYGQAIKGRNEGRAEGLIDTRYFIYFIDAITILQKSKSWSVADEANMQQWMKSFLVWMQTSQIGIEEKEAKNNHGVWYDAQALAIANYIKDTKLANSIIQQSFSRLQKQLNNDGFFPLELERTTSLHYTVFILNAFVIIAQLSEGTENNLWTMPSKSGKTLQKAIEVLIPFITTEKEWTGKQIKPFKSSDAFPILLRAVTKLNCSNCMDALKKLAGQEADKLLLNLL